jgi:hypothetical protein
MMSFSARRHKNVFSREQEGAVKTLTLIILGLTVCGMLASPTAWAGQYEEKDRSELAKALGTLSELFHLKADGQGAIQLLVDGAPSQAGPLLVLNTLDYCSAAMAGPPCAPTALTDPYPPFLIQRYGTGHTIVLEYRGSPSP